MGPPSPFIGTMRSPMLGAKSPHSAASKSPSMSLTSHTSPCLRALDLAAPADRDSSAGSTEDTSWALPASSEPDSAEDGWGAHLDSDRLAVINTFLDFERREPLYSRSRALSDWSGAQARLEVGLGDVTYEELTAPLLGASFGGLATPKPKERSHTPRQRVRSRIPSDDQQWALPPPAEELEEMPPQDSSAGGYWNEQLQEGSMTWWQAVPGSMCMWPAEPRPPSGKPLFRPKWHYGNSWPFNCAPTTLLIGNLPPELTQLQLLAVLDKLGFCGFYDFVFLPSDLKTGRHIAPAIVNLTRHSYAVTLATHMHEFKDWDVGDGALASTVKWSLPLQGLAEHIENYRNDDAMHDSVDDSLRPMLFMQGWRVEFPAPTKRMHGRR
eukprot:TRINITY_DN37417_c0_g1_i1.p1 TRINITY_DN37417_c0_g1~~TRINITY_DN37417_c0_g1_i1.p1  ORF type:complete len:382 (+),score=64.63 TRINITY_DN37417_c0_g1_i1:169-1314(+)